MNVNDAIQSETPRKARKRVGRGTGSGKGKTCGRGHKGAKSRAGWSQRFGYEGGQMSYTRRLPKRGFNNARFATRFDVVNLGQLEKAFADGDRVDPATLRQKLGLKLRHRHVKILGQGELTKKLQVAVHGISSSARKRIEELGGSVTKLSVTASPGSSAEGGKADKSTPTES